MDTEEKNDILAEHSNDARVHPVKPETIAAPEPAEKETDSWTIAKAIIREIAETVILALIMVFVIQLFIKNFRVDGHSMDPNLHHGQYLVVDKISYNLPFNLSNPERGDVIVFVPPTQPDKDFVKRIVGLPGDTVEIKKGQIYINNQLFPNLYQARLDRYSMQPLTVPEGEFFVMGDNRANSNDSRNWGTLEAEKIIGRAWFSYWPPSNWGVIPSDQPTESATLFNLFQKTDNSP